MRASGHSRLPALGLGLVLVAASAVAAEPPRPDVLIVTIDTLRADRMSAYGYERPTSPNLDRVIAAGVRFDQARTVEPLTAPALASMMTSLFPHESGASRNGLRMRRGLASLPKLLQAEGYRTAAFVSNWTLRDKISGMGEHFEDYNEVLKRKRWFGLVSSEATADDVTELALDWLRNHQRSHPDRPFLLWVHYSEPHAPYRTQKAHVEALGLPTTGEIPASDRYDTEIAEADRSVGDLLAAMQDTGALDDTLIAFAADHGESLGEHGYWGHGRHLYEPTLRIPMALSWRGRLEPGVVEAPALIIDLAPTIAGLLGLTPLPGFTGYDWTGVLDGTVDEPARRVTRHQAHKGAVISRHDSDVARRSGLLAVAVVQNGLKEILRVKNGRRWHFDLNVDPAELSDLALPKATLPESLQEWMRLVDSGLTQNDPAPDQPLDEETIEQLRALGYAD